MSYFKCLEAVLQMWSVKKVFLKILKNPQENTRTRDLDAKRETLAQVFSCEFCKIFKSNSERWLLLWKTFLQIQEISANNLMTVNKANASFFWREAKSSVILHAFILFVDDVMKTWSVLIEIFMLCWHLSNAPKHQGWLQKKHCFPRRE